MQAREDDEAKRTAGIIGHRVAEMQRASQVEGDQMERKLIDDAAGLASYFYQRPVLRSIFSEVAVIGPGGRTRPRRTKVNGVHREAPGAEWG